MTKEIGFKLSKLHIENFQSIKDLEIDFEDSGVYRFTGADNNIGKSSLLKAISVCMRNVSNIAYKEMLRDEVDTFKVTMIDNVNNQYVTLSRGNVDFYEWKTNGQTGRMDKTNGKVPLEVQKIFNLYIEKEKTNECLNIRLPRERLLFVDLSAGDNAMIFQKALGTEDYMLAIKQVDSRAREINKEVKLEEGHLTREKEKLEEVSSKLIEDKEELAKIEKFANVLRKDYEEYGQIKDVFKQAEEITERTKEIKQKQAILKGLDIKPIQTHFDTLTQVENCLKAYKEIENIEDRIKEAKDNLTDIEYKEFYTDIKTLEQIEETIEVAKEVTRESKKVKDKKERLVGVKQELADFESEIDLCPFCGAEFTGTHTH